MNIAIIGLGLIGGSIAKAFKANTNHTVFGANRSVETVNKAIEVGAIDAALDDEKLKSCDLVIIALYPERTIEWLQNNAHLISKDAIITDTCGVKKIVCEPCEEIAKQHGLTFIGAHPMAGIEKSGFDYSKPDMFNNASLILVPAEDIPEQKVQQLDEMMKLIGFGKTVITTPEEHDRMIAFTSQLAHVVSSAYVQLPCALNHVGFSAGSYRDMTRVATLNEDMWTELFMENSDMLYQQIDELIDTLKTYSELIRTKNADDLHELLKRGRLRKAAVDGKVLR